MKFDERRAQVNMDSPEDLLQHNVVGEVLSVLSLLSFSYIYEIKQEHDKWN